MGIFDARLDLSRRLANYRPQVTTLSDVLYGTPQKPREMSGLSPAALAGDPLADLRKQAQTMFKDTQRRNQALQIAQGQAPEQPWYAKPLQFVFDNPVARTALKPLEILDYGRKAILSTVQEAGDFLEGKGWSNQDWKDQVADPNFGFGKVIGDFTGVKWVDRALGLVGDIAFDPLTYVSLGAGPLMEKAGIEVTGAAARLALAEKVLAVTGDAEKAKVVAKSSIAGARKVLTAAELADVGIGRAGVMFFGKKLPAIRVPLTGKLAEAGEAALTRMRLAATSNKVGSFLQRGITPKWLKEERLALLRGEVPTEQFAEKLVALNSRNAYRAEAAAAHRSATASLRQAFDISKIKDSAELRGRMHLLLEGVEQPANAAEREALAAWKTAFGQMWDAMDKRLQVLDPNHTVGRVDRYFPHVVTEEARAWLRGGGAEAKKIIETFGLDDLGTTSFFNPRRLKKGSEFFGVVLDHADLNVSRLNQIAKDAGFVGEFFDSDILRVAEKYAADYAEQMGRIGSIAHMVENGTINHIEQKLEFDPDLAKAAERRYKDAVGRQLKATAKATEASSRAAKALEDHFIVAKKAEQSLLTASEREAKLIAAPVQKAQKELDDAIEALDGARVALQKEESALRELLDPSLDDDLVAQVEKQYQEILTAVDEAGASFRQYRELQDQAGSLVSLEGQRLEEARGLAAAKSKELAALDRRRQDLIEFNEWIGNNYNKIVNGVEDVAPHGIDHAPTLTFLRSIFSSTEGADDLKKFLGAKSATKGEFADYLAEVIGEGGDENLIKLMGRENARSTFSKMSIKQADEILRSSGGNSGGLPTIIAGGVRIAQVMYSWGGRENVPEFMRKVLEDAEKALADLQEIRSFQRMIAEAPRQRNQYERLLQRYGAVGEEIADDIKFFSVVDAKRADLERKWQRATEFAERERARVQRGHHNSNVRAEQRAALQRAQEIADRAFEDLRQVEQIGDQLMQKRYTFASANGQTDATLVDLAKAEADQGGEEVITKKRRPPATYGIGDAQELVPKKIEKTLQRQQTAEVADAAAASRRVDESRRVPMSEVKKKLQGQKERGDEALAALKADEANPTLTARKRLSLERTAARGEEAKKQLATLPDEAAPWFVQGRTAQDTRHEALFKLEEFVMAADVAQRFAALTNSLADVGMEASEKMLDDLFRNVRTQRMEKWIVRSTALDDAARSLRSGVDALESGMTPQELRKALYDVRTRAYDALGDDAVSLLGPRAQWAEDPQGILDEIKRLDKAVDSAPKGSVERTAALAARKEYYATQAKVFYKEINAGLSGKVSVDEVKRALKRMAKEVDAGSMSKSIRSLYAMEDVVRKEAAFSRRLRNLYRQIDDVDYSAVQAFAQGVGTKQVTPSWKATAYEAAASAIDRRIKVLEELAPVGNLERAVARREQLAAGRRVAEAEGRLASSREALADLHTRISAFERSPQVQVARTAYEEQGLLRQFANVDGWRLTDEDWQVLGMRPAAAYDPQQEAVLQGYLDSRLAEGQQTFIKVKERVKVGAAKGSSVEAFSGPKGAPTSDYRFLEQEVYKPVERASDIPHGATLYTTGEGWVEIGADEAARIAGWSPSISEVPVRKTQRIVQDLEKELDVARREAAGVEEQLRRGYDLVAKAEADPNFVIRRPLNAGRRLEQIDREIEQLSEQVLPMLRAAGGDYAEFRRQYDLLDLRRAELNGEKQKILAYQKRDAAVTETFGRDRFGEQITETDVSVPLTSEMTEVVDPAELRRTLDEQRWRLMQRKTAVQEINDRLVKARQYDALAAKHQPPPVKGQTLDEAVLASKNLKTETVEIRMRDRVGSRATDTPVLDENGVPTGLFKSEPAYMESMGQVRKYYKRGNSGVYTALPLKDPRKPASPFTFTREEWESLFAYGLDDLPARKQMMADASAASRKVKKIEAEIASTRGSLSNVKGKLARLEKEIADFPPVPAGRAGRSAGHAKGLLMDQADSLRAVISSHEANLRRLNSVLEEATQATKTASVKTRESALKKYRQMISSFRSANPNGFDDAAYKASQRVLSDGKFNTLSEGVVNRRVRLLEDGWNLSPHAQVINDVDELSRMGMTAVAIENGRRDMAAQLARLRRLRDAADHRFAEASKDVRVAAEDLAREAGLGEVTPSILRDARSSAASLQKRAGAAKAEIGATRTGIIGGVDEGFVARTVDAPKAAAEADKAAAEGAAAVAAERTKAAQAIKGEIDKRTAAELKAVEKANADGAKKVDALIRQSGDWQSALAVKRERQLARTVKARGVEAGRSQAATEAAWNRVRVQMDAAEAISQSNLPSRAADAAEARANLEAAIFDRDMLERVRKGKAVSRARRSELEAQSRLGAQAKQRLLLGGDVPDKELIKLERAIQTGEKADKVLKAINASDDEAIQMMKVYKDVLALDTLPPNDPLRAVLSDAVARESDLLFAQGDAAAAEYWMLNSQAFASKWVDDIKDGWTSLKEWGLPSLQSSETLKAMFDNISRVKNPSLLGELNQFLSRYTRFFKTYATLSVGFHVRNALSNTLMVFAAGADIENMARGMRLYEGWLTAEREGGEAMRHFLAGLEKTGQREVFEKSLRAVDAAGGGRSVEMFADEVGSLLGSKLTNNRVTRASRRFGERVEGSGRFMLAYDSVAKGADFNQATARVKRYLFDYMDTSSMDEAVKNIIPFWIWMSRNFPLQVVNQWKNPKMYAMYSSLMRNISEDEQDGKIVPKWMKETGAVAIGSDWYLTPDTGFNRLQQQANEFTDPARLASYVNPLLRVPLEVLGNRRLYNDTPFSDKPKEITGGLASPLIGAMLSVLGQTDTTGPKGVMNAQGDQILPANATVTSDRWNYALMNLLPMLAQSERLVPATEDYKARQGSSILNYLGIPLRQLTPQMQESEVARREREMMALATQAKNLGYTP